MTPIQHTYDFRVRRYPVKPSLIILSAILAVTEGRTTCSISYLEADLSASLTCRFSESVILANSNFTVYRYSVHNVIQILLECYSKNSRLYCNKEDNVRYDIRLTNSVTVNIPSNIIEESRLYWCNVGGSEPHSTMSCGLPAEHPDGLFTNCSRYIPENTSVSCQCGVHHSGIPPASASWDRHRPVSFLTAVAVRQENSSSVLGTCYLLWPGDGNDIMQETAIHLAYGPYNESLFIEGPTKFIDNGSLWITITCKATDVNPIPLITWEGVSCRNDGTADSQCTFMPPVARSEVLTARCIAVNKYNHGKTAVKVINIESTYFKNVEVEEPAERRLIVIVSTVLPLVMIISFIVVIIYVCFLKGRRIYDHPEQRQKQDLGLYSNVLPITCAPDKEKVVCEKVQCSSKSSGLKSKGTTSD